MISKPSRLALTGMALVCAAIFAACNCAPTLRYLTVAPNNGTIYVSGGIGSGVKGARRVARPAARPVVQNSRKAAVKPQDITTAVCGSLQYAATAYYSNGTTQDQSSAVTWSSSDTTVAAIDNTGFASGIGIGFSNIGASLNGVTASTVPLEVDLLTSIGVTPAKQSIALGQTEQFAASGNFILAADGSSVSEDISGQVTWNSSDTEVATIDNTGNATSVGQGTTTITATSCDGLTVGQTTLTVGAPAPQSLQISPAAPTASVGTTVQFTAVELLSDGSTQPAQHPITWSSDTTGVATIDPSTGLAQALSAGTANITATESVSNFTGTAVLTVQAAAARFAYVANVQGGSSFSGSISSYTVDVTSSTPLTPLTETPAASPEQVLLHPSGDLLYYIDSGGTLHSEFVNSADGSLTSTGLTPTPASNLGSDLYIGVIDPTGRFVYVITNGNSVLYGFKITHTQPSGGTNDGALTAIAGLTAYTDSTLNFPSWIMTDRAGKYLYVVNQGDGVNPSTVSEYSINQSTGALTPLGTPTIPTGVLPEFGTTDVNGHLYVANQGGTSGSVSGYSINSSNGQLSSVGADTVITGASDSINVLTDPTGKYLYVLDFGSTSNGQVFAYNLNTSTGVIGSVIGSPQPTDLSPTGMAIDPTGVLLAIDNFDGADISLYSVNSGTGGLTPTTPATVAAGTKTEFVVFYTAASGQ